MKTLLQSPWNQRNSASVGETYFPSRTSFPRALLTFVRSLRAYAFLQGREYILPEDAVFLAVPVLAHRIVPAPVGASSGVTAESLVEEIVKTLPVPV